MEGEIIMKKFIKNQLSGWHPLIYTTAKVKDDAPVYGAGEFVKVFAHINNTLYRIRFQNGTVKNYHKDHLERFTI